MVAPGKAAVAGIVLTAAAVFASWFAGISPRRIPHLASRAFRTASRHFIDINWKADATASASFAEAKAGGISGSSTSGWRIDGLDIPPGHPRIFWNDARLAQARRWWSKNSYRPNYKNENPFDPYDTLFACLMTGDRTWCNAQIQWAVNLDETNCYRTIGCDSMRGFGEAALLTYDWLYAQLMPEQRATIVDNWDRWQGYMDASNRWGNTGMPSSNYFAGAFRNDFSLGVASFGDNRDAGRFIEYALNNRWPALENFASAQSSGPLGGKGYAQPAQEGSQYGRYSTGYYALPLTAATLLGRNLWTESPAFESEVLQVIYNTMPKPTASRGIYDGWTWSDDEDWVQSASLYGGGGMQSRYYGDFMMAAAQQFADAPIGKLAREWLATVKPEIGPIWKATDIVGASAQPLETLPLDYYAAGPQFAYWRSSWKDSASALFLQMGETFGVGHSHFDVGNIQWFRDGEYLIRETPSYDRTAAGPNSSGTVSGNTGYAHNLPLIGGLPGVTAGCMDANGAVRRLESQAAYAYIDADLTGTYSNKKCASNHPERGNPYAKHVEREAIFFRDIDVLLVLDRLQADSATRGRTFLSHCETRPRVIDDVHYVCAVGKQEARYSVLLPPSPSPFVVNESANGATCARTECQYRLEINDAHPEEAESYFLIAIQGKGGNDAALSPTIHDDGASWTVTLDANHSATLNKGMSAAGGFVTIGGEKSNLRGDVERMTIADSGPEWQKN